MSLFPCIKLCTLNRVICAKKVLLYWPVYLNLRQPPDLQVSYHNQIRILFRILIQLEMSTIDSKILDNAPKILLDLDKYSLVSKIIFPRIFA